VRQRREVAGRADAEPCEGITGIASASSSACSASITSAAPPNAAPEAEQLQHDHQPRDMPRQRLAEPAAVRQDQVALQLGQALVAGCAPARAGRSRC
jgi:hypothetical protein